MPGLAGQPQLTRGQEQGNGVSIVSIEAHVAAHYTQGTLELRILAALREAGKERGSGEKSENACPTCRA